jgi:hypothetical protein
MYKIILNILILLFAFTKMNATNISVLFIGNSFTSMNDFSQMVSEIALEMNDTIYTDFAAIDSYTLEKHFYNQETINKINERNWDYVVLQEQSQRPVLDTNSFNNKTLFYADKLLNIIYKNNPCTQPLLFMTWGRKYGDSELCAKYNYTCNYSDMQDKLIERYFLLGDILNVAVVPCGIGWKYFNTDPYNYIDLFYPDNSHPNEVGSFLNALMFYCAITESSAIESKYNPANLTEDELLIMQQIVFEIVQQYFIK